MQQIGQGDLGQGSQSLGTVEGIVDAFGSPPVGGKILELNQVRSFEIGARAGGADLSTGRHPLISSAATS